METLTKSKSTHTDANASKSNDKQNQSSGIPFFKPDDAPPVLDVKTTKTTKTTKTEIVDKKSVAKKLTFNYVDFPILTEFKIKQSVILPVSKSDKLKSVEFTFKTMANFSDKLNYKITPKMFGFLIRSRVEKQFKIGCYFDNPVTDADSSNIYNVTGVGNKSAYIHNKYYYGLVVKLNYIVELKHHWVIPSAIKSARVAYVIRKNEFGDKFKPLKTSFEYVTIESK